MKQGVVGGENETGSGLAGLGRKRGGEGETHQAVSAEYPIGDAGGRNANDAGAPRVGGGDRSPLPSNAMPCGRPKPRKNVETSPLGLMRQMASKLEVVGPET
jgi:hypothetical protein